MSKRGYDEPIKNSGCSGCKYFLQGKSHEYGSTPDLCKNPKFQGIYRDPINGPKVTYSMCSIQNRWLQCEAFEQEEHKFWFRRIFKGVNT